MAVIFRVVLPICSSGVQTELLFITPTSKHVTLELEIKLLLTLYKPWSQNLGGVGGGEPKVNKKQGRPMLILGFLGTGELSLITWSFLSEEKL